jgi:hypothetical protein
MSVVDVPKDDGAFPLFTYFRRNKSSTTWQLDAYLLYRLTKEVWSFDYYRATFTVLERLVESCCRYFDTAIEAALLTHLTRGMLRRWILCVSTIYLSGFSKKRQRKSRFACRTACGHVVLQIASWSWTRGD